MMLLVWLMWFMGRCLVVVLNMVCCDFFGSLFYIGVLIMLGDMVLMWTGVSFSVRLCVSDLSVVLMVFCSGEVLLGCMLRKLDMKVSELLLVMCVVWVML